MAEIAIKVRPARFADVPALCAFLNEIIRIGGTTAHKAPFTHESFVDHFLAGPGFVSCFVAEDGSGQPCAFQALERFDSLPEGWADIGTFARPHAKLPGAGTALFAATKAHARDSGLTAINATIRADNVGGLAYYSKMGFVDYKIDKAVPLKDGRAVDRISKRYLF
ncbi:MULTISPECIES: GNAT family N-acetyltransferase [Sinorhizobium]|uniref:GNAT family acetyltransferase n=2 Tax=Sinorhizobium TaxID=28105 RepID=A0A2S3YKP5_9HYPH|nr:MULTISPECIES: GNAT family protein [Sinorhizobium]ASY58930.1 acetyltransferase, GNAT family [Sinorhizobium sp. CCBAU 05631]AUX74849.1 GCN5-related N-acetyltransferase protein [Sinorhizobium fredii]PDT41731.1 N-acetyltransferase [Sinorhizobium sp. FG01]PDT53710.1 N-acetyltransferase [Sinorhizobium sp. NG07B]POH28544.1 GNAT family acetyltransferase [Sinorhizobium americanum]